MALSFPLREAMMSLRSSLAAMLRSTRAARGLSQEQLGSSIGASHLHSAEHAKATVTLDMLEQICGRLEVDPVALLAMASCYARQESLPAYTAHLQTELAKLEAMGVLSSMPSHFKDGVLRTGKAGKRPIPVEKIKAVHNCKAEGLSQKETAIKLGMSTTTVHKIWHSQPD